MTFQNDPTATYTSYCYDWIINSGTTHYARDRYVFTTYRPVNRLVDNPGRPKIFVAGIGTVELRVKIPGSTRILPRSRTLVLDNVLHLPHAVCNGFSARVYHKIHGGDMGKDGGADAEGLPLWCSEKFGDVSRLVLETNMQSSGLGVSFLCPGVQYGIDFNLRIDLAGIAEKVPSSPVQYC
ncbi:hypothetical protein BDV10DRAFT_185374 [Aspergillus recurvatus]